MSESLAVEFVALLTGLLFGSFLNVCIARLPSHQSIVFPGSHCPFCMEPIAWYDNVPLLSYAMLRGRCRRCSKKISLRYPLVEALVGLWFIYAGYQTMAVLQHQETLTIALLQGITLASLGFLLIGILFMDWQTQIIPDTMTYSGIALGVLLACIETMYSSTGSERLTVHPLSSTLIPLSIVSRRDLLPAGSEHLLYSRVLAIAILSGMLLGIRWIYKKMRGQDGLGLGDVKLMAMVASLIGLWPSLLTLMLGTILCSLYACVLLLCEKANTTTRLPLGSFLSISGLITACFGAAILNWYAELFR